MTGVTGAARRWIGWDPVTALIAPVIGSSAPLLGGAFLMVFSTSSRASVGHEATARWAWACTPRVTGRSARIG